MNRILRFAGLVAMLLAMTANEARAEFPWQGGQVLTGVGGEVPLVSDRLALTSQAIHFWTRSNHKGFTYVGPSWVVNNQWWIAAPLVGAAINWRDTDGNGVGDSDAAIVSLQTGLTFFDRTLTVFLEGEGYFSHDTPQYYGIYMADYCPPLLDRAVCAGLNAENVDDNVQFGPHLKMQRGPWQGRVEYYAGAQDEVRGHAVRFVNIIYFPGL